MFLILQLSFKLLVLKVQNMFDFSFVVSFLSGLLYFLDHLSHSSTILSWVFLFPCVFLCITIIGILFLCILRYIPAILFFVKFTYNFHIWTFSIIFCFLLDLSLSCRILSNAVSHVCLGLLFYIWIFASYYTLLTCLLLFILWIRSHQLSCRSIKFNTGCTPYSSLILGFMLLPFLFTTAFHSIYLLSIGSL